MEAENTTPSFLEHAGTLCKLTIKKAWKAKLEGGLWMSIPFDWDTVGPEVREAIKAPEGFVPFAVVGPITDDALLAAVKGDLNHIFAFDAARKVFKLDDDDGPIATAVTVDEMPFRPDVKKKAKKG